MQADVHIVNTENGKHGSQSLARGLAILSAFSRDRRDFSVRDLATLLGISRPTAYRLARTLEQHSFLKFDPVSRSYSVGSAAFALGRLFLPESFSDAMDEVLEELCRATTYTVHVAVLDGSSLVMIAAKESRSLTRVVAHVGQRIPWHATAAGKAFLAGLQNPKVLELIGQSGMPKFASRTITDLNALLAELEVVRRQGFATATDEFAEGLRSFGTLIQVPKSVSPHTLAISMPSGLRQNSGHDERLATYLRTAADRLAAIIAQFTPFVGEAR